MARDRARNWAPHTKRACRIFCGLTPEATIAVGRKQREATSPNRPEPVYEQWRANIRAAFAVPSHHEETKTTAY